MPAPRSMVALAGLAPVLEAIAMAKRRQLTSQESPTDLWIRAAEPEE